MKTAQWWSKIVVIGLALFLIASYSPTAAQAPLCRALYLDAGTQQLMLLDVDSGTTVPIPTYAAPASDVGEQYASIVLSPDARYLAVAANDTRQIVSDQRVGTQIFDLSKSVPTLIATIPLHWPVAWSFDGSQLLVRRLISVAGFYQLYDLKRQTIAPLYQITAPQSEPVSGRTEVFLNVTNALWSESRMSLVFAANEQPFPQDANGVNTAIYASNLVGQAMLLSDRIANAELIGWLRDGRILFEQCLNGNCEWIAAQPDGSHRDVIRATFTDRQDVYDRLAPSGDQIVLLTHDDSGADHLNLLDIATRQISPIATFAGELPPILAWSPDGRYFTYAELVNGRIKPTLVDTLNHKSLPLDSTPSSYGRVGAWTSDSTRLLLTGADTLTIHEVTSAQTRAVKLPTTTAFEAWFPARWVCSAN
ncbi:MAG: hypothetical protein KF716_04730 [Anaerolineae bacterium]|nr:hypothetical protein [Anaerolineae bacterium]